MAGPLSEDQARAALRAVQSEASNPAFFDAERREHGWVFGWREEWGEPPMGTHTWVVDDDGAVRMLGYQETF